MKQSKDPLAKLLIDKDTQAMVAYAKKLEQRKYEKLLEEYKKKDKREVYEQIESGRQTEREWVFSQTKNIKSLQTILIEDRTEFMPLAKKYPQAKGRVIEAETILGIIERLTPNQ